MGQSKGATRQRIFKNHSRFSSVGSSYQCHPLRATQVSRTAPWALQDLAHLKLSGRVVLAERDQTGHTGADLARGGKP